MNPAPVGFEFRFARTSGADAAAQPRHRRAVPGQPRQQIIQLRQLHLQLAFPRPRAARENIQDQLRPVQHLHVQRAFEIALLRGRQLAVENHRGRFVEQNLRLQLFHFAGADNVAASDSWTRLNLAFGNPRAGRRGQRRQFFHRIFGARWPGSAAESSCCAAAAGQMQADQDRDFFAIANRLAASPSARRRPERRERHARRQPAACFEGASYGKAWKPPPSKWRA